MRGSLGFGTRVIVAPSLGGSDAMRSVDLAPDVTVLNLSRRRPRAGAGKRREHPLTSR